MKYPLFVFSPAPQYQYLISIWHFRKNINTKWQLQAWSINTQCNSTQNHPWKTIACPAPLKKQNSVKHGDRKLMRAFSPKWCAVNSYSKKASHAETAVTRCAVDIGALKVQNCGQHATNIFHSIDVGCKFVAMGKKDHRRISFSAPSAGSYGEIQKVRSQSARNLKINTCLASKSYLWTML